MVKPLAQLGDSKQAPKRRNGGRASARRTLLSHPSKHLPSQPVSRFEERVCDLSVKLDKLLVLQEESVKRLDAIGHEEMLSDLRAVMGSVREKVELQEQRLEGLERLFSGIQQLFGVFAEVVKRSFWAGGLKSKRKKSNGLKDKDGKEKSKPYPKVVKSHKKKKPQDGADSVHAGLEDVEKLNQQNDHFSQSTAGTSSTPLLDLIHEDPSHEKQDDRLPVEDKFLETLEVKGEEEEEEERIEKEEDSRLTEEIRQISQNSSDLTLEGTTESCEEHLEIISSAKRHVTDETLETDELKKSRVEETSEEEAKGAEEEEEEEEEAEPKDDALEAEPETPAEETEEERKDEESEKEEFVIDSSPPPPAPFEHRLVTPKTHQITSFYDINKDEVLGGGRFGVVHKCVEKSSGLILAAKVIKARSQKEKDVVKSEIEVMNQLNHANLIQLYGAFESRHEFILVMEYVDGGELFDRIIDENYKLTELATVLFIRQISEGLQYMHKMYILHLDLKPENILCVSRETNKIKIIDFGLARRYKPREKLRVNFGTPEFLAPEVINYEFVSFPTDMWSLGVITYMLLSGLSPFLGEDDNETLNNILACQWSFEEAEFADISEEAKDFISRLLVKSKSWRMSASQSLKHPWLSDRALHYRLHHKKNKCHSSHAPPAEG